MNRKRQNSTNKARAAGRKPAAEQVRAAGKESPRKRPADAPYKKNDLVTVRIRDIAEGGEGIGRVPATDGQSAGYTLFVKDAVIGDIVQAQITKPGRSYAYARLYAISEPSPHRVQAPCPVYRSCGGCQLQALDYARQLAYKTGKVRSDLQRIDPPVITEGQCGIFMNVVPFRVLHIRAGIADRGAVRVAEGGLQQGLCLGDDLVRQRVVVLCNEEFQQRGDAVLDGVDDVVGAPGEDLLGVLIVLVLIDIAGHKAGNLDQGIILNGLPQTGEGGQARHGTGQQGDGQQHGKQLE